MAADSAQAPGRPVDLLPGLQRQRHDRESRHHGAQDRPATDVRLRDHHRQRRQRDATPEIADELARTYPEVRVIHHPKNRGYGGALRTGFTSARKELIFYTDGDAQYDPAELELLWPRDDRRASTW